jgi:hypothetical protein
MKGSRTIRKEKAPAGICPVAQNPIWPTAMNARKAATKVMAPLLRETGSGSKRWGSYQRVSLTS